ncbi:hypothetical protein THAOC_27573 [Thalassiosira oceanica]|uniref:B30.2/SPRY domain-containing protein n=1 Tax=Thalassiosira oceanica TaxID=159749 RepID=K0S2C0_THAOC|nr:hypothetical protein THAOC_27573 [Thalassiosira oceanica]|eukprot:EJK53057.1 hypothetical protein THAOC_27573 [Thalassiosira oceanica]
MMLRSKLTFDQLGTSIQHGEDRSIILTVPGQRNASSAFCNHVTVSAALCSNHVLRSGKHFAVFTGLKGFSVIGVVRPVQIKLSDFGEGELKTFDPRNRRFWEYQLRQRTARWTDSNVHCCSVSKVFASGSAFSHDWRSDKPGVSIDGLQSDTPIGLLLDLEEGTLSIYQNGQRLATLKDGLSGEYCWYAAVGGFTRPISIKRGFAPDDQRTG